MSNWAKRLVSHSTASISVQLGKTLGVPFKDVFLYGSTIGTLHYLTQTQPELSFIVNKLSQFLQQPIDVHWTACKRILRYLKGTMRLSLYIRPSSHQSLFGYTNTNWASDIDDRRSTKGYCVFFW